jgi:hypothetical protein
MSRHRLGLLLAATAALPLAARADRRYYGETYSAVTAPPGGLDLEGWTTFHQAPRAGGADFWRHQLEVETGITDRWDAALYGLLKQESGLRFEGLKLESRYRLSEPGRWPIDTVLYLEVRKELIHDKPWAIEEKLILARDFRAVNLSANLLAEQELVPGGGREYEYGYALAASYEFHPSLRLGAEAFGGWTNVREAGTSTWEKKHWAGPALSVAYSRFWLVLAAGFGLTDESDRTRLRAIFAVQL